jgi:hypothetical protein
MFDIVLELLVCRRPRQLPPMSVQTFIPCLTSPALSGEPAVSDVVAVEGGALVNHNYTMSEREDDEDGQASCGAAAAEPAAGAEPEAAAQAAAGQKRCRLDLCAMHCNKNTAMQKAGRRRAQNTAIRIRIPRAGAKTM